MGVPATTGVLRNNIADMKNGDYIKVYQKSSDNTFVSGDASGGELPVTGQPLNSHKDKHFYFVKIDKGLLVSDRVWIHTWSWDALNTSRQAQGLPYTVLDKQGIIRSLTGGVAYADANGNKSLVDLNTGLAFPSNSEFDKYIVGFDTNLIQSGKTVFDVFHHDVVKTWTLDTPIINIGANTTRVCRGGTTGTNNFSILTSSTANTTVGFRPCFNYNE